MNSLREGKKRRRLSPPHVHCSLLLFEKSERREKLHSRRYLSLSLSLSSARAHHLRSPMRHPSLNLRCGSGVGGLASLHQLLAPVPTRGALTSTSAPSPPAPAFAARRRHSTSTPAAPPRAGASASWGSASRNAPWRERGVEDDGEGDESPNDDGTDDVEKRADDKPKAKVVSSSIASTSTSLSPSEQATAARASGRPLRINIDLLLVSFVLHRGRLS